MKLLINTSLLFIILGIIIIFSDSVGFSPGVPMGGANMDANIVTNIIGMSFTVIGLFALYFELKKR